MSFIENTSDFSERFPTYIIAYCPDTDEFFVTNQRCFFWEFQTEFKSEEEAIEYFESHLEYFVKKKDEIRGNIFRKKVTTNYVYLSNVGMYTI